MNSETFPPLGFFIERNERQCDYGLELSISLYNCERRDLVASFSSTLRMSDGVQCLNTSSQFIQRNYLSQENIDAVTLWLTRLSRTSRHRLTTYTVPIR